MTSEEGEEWNKEHTSRQTEYRIRKLDGLTAQEWEEQRKQNADRQRAYRQRKSKQLEEARNQFAEQQQKRKCRTTRQISTNIPMESTLENGQGVMVKKQCVADMVQFQSVPITNMIPNADRQKVYQKIKLDELTAEEWEEQRKRNADRQREYRERKLKQLEEARNQFAEQ